MINCNHCGFGFAAHRDDATCPTAGCPFMREDGADQKKRRTDICKCGRAREDHQYSTGPVADCAAFQFSAAA